MKAAITFLIAVTGLPGLGSISWAQEVFESKRVSFSTPAREYAPAFFGNDLVFCSDRKSSVFFSFTDFNNNIPSNLYLSHQKKPGKFDNADLFAPELTTFLFDGPSCFSKDGKTIYYTRSIDVTMSLNNKRREDTTFGIFSATLRDGRWTELTKFRYNRPGYNTGYPCLSDDGEQLFFCTNNPDGYGGYDIYVSALENGRWAAPKNLGELVNTPANEVFPFYHVSGRLYFASRGHGGDGDLDIFYTQKINGSWQKPVRLGSPFNSKSDDYALIFNEEMDTGYYSSDRAGNTDIFAVHATFPSFTDCKPQQENDYCFVFYEPNNNEVDTTAFAYEWDLGDGTRIRNLEAEHCFKEPGTYLVQLNVVDKLTKEVYFSQASHSFLVEDIEQPFIASPDSVRAGEELTLHGRDTYLKDFTIGGYYWDFNDGTRADGLETRHSFVFPGIYEIRLGIASETSGKDEQPQKRCATKKIVVLATNP